MIDYQGVSIDKDNLEFLRIQSKQRFDNVRGTWVDLLQWVAPWRARWLLSQNEGERNNRHVVDATHILALRSYVAGFLEGNTSANRPWFRTGTKDRERDLIPQNHAWLDIFTRKCHSYLTSSNFYDAAGQFYYDYGSVNTGAYYIQETENGFHFHNLIPGSYYVINDEFGVAKCMVREFQMTVKALVSRYGKKVNGTYDWSNFSGHVKKMYQDGHYTQRVEVVHIMKENPQYDPDRPVAMMNRPWLEIAYELGSGTGEYIVQDGPAAGTSAGPDVRNKDLYLEIAGRERKPFIVGKSTRDFEYGESGPSIQALGLIKSLNKKALGKDQALEQMLRPALQGPANLRKSYITTNPNSYVPLDPTSLAQKGLRSIYEVNPAIQFVVGDVEDMRQQVNQLYYADFLLYLSLNPKTRTATETDAVVNEQKMVIGPNLQSLDWSHNEPIVDFVMNYVLQEDPNLPPPPPDLQGEFLRPEFISVFAQAQKAADLPSVDRYMAMISQVGQLNPEIWDKANIDRLADIYEDRLYLPAGLNNPQDKVEGIRQQRQAAQQRQQQIEQMREMAGAAKDVGLQAKQNTGEGQ